MVMIAKKYTIEGKIGEDKQRVNELKGEREEGEYRSKHFRMRLTKSNTSKTSFGARAIWTAFLVLHFGCLLSEGLVINPRRITTSDPSPENHTHNYTYCLGTQRVIQFLDPFDKGLLIDYPEFDSVTWYVDLGNTGSDDTVYVIGNAQTKDIKNTRYKGYAYWGIQLDNVTKADEGLYTAEFRTTNVDESLYAFMAIIVGTAPELVSSKLELKKQVENETVSLTCGEIGYFGDPPINLQLRRLDGEILSSSNSHEILSVKLPQENDTGGYVCEPDWADSPAADCIRDHERKAWIATIDAPAENPGTSHLLQYAIAGGMAVVCVVGIASYVGYVQLTAIPEPPPELANGSPRATFDQRASMSRNQSTVRHSMVLSRSMM